MTQVQFTLWRALQIALDCARGLAYLHNRQPRSIIHRDLKPANLMLGGPKCFSLAHKKALIEELGVLKIADFGLSKSLKLLRPLRRGGGSSVDVSRHSKIGEVTAVEKALKGEKGLSTENNSAGK